MVEMSLDEAVLKSWIGMTETTSDLMTAHQAQLLAATLDQEGVLKDGDPLPALWHWIYFLSTTRTSDLGRDGHAERGGFLPPVALSRRMWAGGRFDVTSPIILGEQISRVSTIKDVSLKQGRTGGLCFVTVRHEFSGEDDTPRLSEEHDIVFREGPVKGTKLPEPVAAPVGAEAGAEWSRTIEPSAVLLFRYSALTFNGHRIHYDLDFCRDEEGYPGLVFHGPLTATLLAELAVEHADGRPLQGFTFRAVAPLFDTEPFVLRGKPKGEGGQAMTLWAETPDGHLAMTAEAVFG